MEKLVALIVGAMRIVQTIGGTYAAFKLSLYGIAYMRKNQQKVEEAKDGMKNVAVGLCIVILAEVIVQVIKNTIGA
ncbi:hypothetical protein [Listeria booriae]|uniref:Uncharacterized protein n=1 Tax=Listeria booriae TaxID=1552123 RepID=A0A842AMA1_9LIST|nr:hypothetical protein [Listeria booriae]MBC1212449.1 hypothetical protein [Listeria booriae]MBC1309325.1 hypothetical protein [Listeria booriae]MBC1403110.1 hypothetical protein [Listeria booriae]MBC1617934.1 hypothetical protein [Listeria booriae]MBC1920319.1 hypothetical protein [Listeria booriae]